MPGVREHSHGVRRGSTDGFLFRVLQFSFHEKGGSGGVPCSRTANFAASAVALSTIAGTLWGSALSTRFTGSGSGFFYFRGSGSGFQFGGAVVAFFFMVSNLLFR